MINRQMELGLESRACASVERRRRRQSRAGWWFERMRQVVDGVGVSGALPGPALRQGWLESAGEAGGKESSEREFRA